MKQIITALTAIVAIAIVTIALAIPQPAAAASTNWVKISSCAQSQTGSANCTLVDRAGKAISTISIASNPANVPMGWSIITRYPGWTFTGYKYGIILVSCNTRTAKCAGQLNFD